MQRWKNHCWLFCRRAPPGRPVLSREPACAHEDIPLTCPPGRPRLYGVRAHAPTQILLVVVHAYFSPWVPPHKWITRLSHTITKIWSSGQRLMRLTERKLRRRRPAHDMMMNNWLDLLQTKSASNMILFLIMLQLWNCVEMKVVMAQWKPFWKWFLGLCSILVWSHKLESESPKITNNLEAIWVLHWLNCITLYQNSKLLIWK